MKRIVVTPTNDGTEDALASPLCVLSDDKVITGHPVIVKIKEFPGHKGIPGHRGGSLPKGVTKPVPPKDIYGEIKNFFDIEDGDIEKFKSHYAELMILPYPAEGELRAWSFSVYETRGRIKWVDAMELHNPDAPINQEKYDEWHKPDKIYEFIQQDIDQLYEDMTWVDTLSYKYDTKAEKTAGYLEAVDHYGFRDLPNELKKKFIDGWVERKKLISTGQLEFEQKFTVTNDKGVREYYHLGMDDEYEEQLKKELDAYPPVIDELNVEETDNPLRTEFKVKMNWRYNSNGWRRNRRNNGIKWAKAIQFENRLYWFLKTNPRIGDLVKLGSIISINWVHYPDPTETASASVEGRRIYVYDEDGLDMNTFVHEFGHVLEHYVSDVKMPGSYYAKEDYFKNISTREYWSKGYRPSMYAWTHGGNRPQENLAEHFVVWFMNDPKYMNDPRLKDHLAVIQKFNDIALTKGAHKFPKVKP